MVAQDSAQVSKSFTGCSRSATWVGLLIEDYVAAQMFATGDVCGVLQTGLFGCQ